MGSIKIRIYKILLPKDYLRFKLTGSYFTEMSDASGTLWLDVKNRQWSEDLLNLSDLTLSQMPKLVEGNEPTDTLSLKIKNELGFEKNVIVAGGAGDQAAGALGSGVIDSNQSMTLKNQWCSKINDLKQQALTNGEFKYK